MLAYLALGPGVYRVARDVFGMGEGHARIAGIATVLSSRLVWSGMSGMETSLAALLMLLVVEEHIRSRSRNCLRPREAIWLGLAFLVRPEFMFVAFILLADWMIAFFRESNYIYSSCRAVAVGSDRILLHFYCRFSHGIA